MNTKTLPAARRRGLDLIDWKLLVRLDVGLEAFALLAGLPGVGVLVVHHLLGLRIPFELAAQADRYVGKVAGSHCPVVTEDIGDRFATVLHALEEILHVIGRVFALVDLLYGVRLWGLEVRILGIE